MKEKRNESRKERRRKNLDHFALRPQKRGCLWGGGGGGGRKSEGSTADTARKRPERPWTAARTMEVLRRCPLAIAQRLVHRAIAVSTAVLGSHRKDNVRCTAVEEQPEAKEVQLSFAAQLHLPARDLFWANLRVQLHLPPLDLASVEPSDAVKCWPQLFIATPNLRETLLLNVHGGEKAY